MNDHKDVIHLLSAHIQASKKDDEGDFKLEQHALDGLEEFYRQVDFYSRNAQVTADFLIELKGCLEQLKKLLVTNNGGDIGGQCFQLVELLCVIMRESSFAAGNPSSVAVQLFEFFENSGLWHPADGTLVTKRYYLALPARYFA